MNVVANSTPLVHLSAMRRLALLEELFSEIWIPKAVYQEIVVDGVGKPGAVEAKNAKWIKSVAVEDELAVTALNSHLGLGESACIVLAKQMAADLVIMDDRLARIQAEALELKVTGTIGLLLLADERQMLNFRDALDDLLTTGFRLSPKVYDHVIQLWQS